MKKRVTYASVLIVAVLILSCLRSTKAQFGDGDVDGSDFLIWQSSLGIGIVPRQMIRITMASAITPGSIIETGADQSAGRAFSFECSVLDQDGVRVFQTARREVPLRGFSSEDILFFHLGGIPAEPPTQRKQLRVIISIYSTRGSRAPRGWLEVIDVDTGKTTIDLDVGVLEVSQNTSL